MKEPSQLRPALRREAGVVSGCPHQVSICVSLCSSVNLKVSCYEGPRVVKRKAVLGIPMCSPMRTGMAGTP